MKNHFCVIPFSHKEGKLNLSTSDMSVKSDNQVKCLGLIFDPNLNLKPYVYIIDQVRSVKMAGY